MNAVLEQQLSALSPEEKAEVVDFLMPSLAAAGDVIPPALLVELERRDAEYERNPSGGLTLEQFDKKWASRQ
jgi:putative addiction module component (TIGR02574 family)